MAGPSGTSLGDDRCITVAHVCYFGGSIPEYQVQFVTWLVLVRPERCPHCGAEHTYIFWGTYARWVYTDTERIRIRIGRVRCRICRVTDALLPSFLHMFRRYTLVLIQQAITLALDDGLWGDDLADAVGPYDQPAFSTMHDWVWSFALSADWLLPWLQHALLVCRAPGGARTRPAADPPAPHPQLQTPGCFHPGLAGSCAWPRRSTQRPANASMTWPSRPTCSWPLWPPLSAPPAASHACCGPRLPLALPPDLLGQFGLWRRAAGQPPVPAQTHILLSGRPGQLLVDWSHTNPGGSP